MISDGILFESDGDGGVTYVETKAIPRRASRPRSPTTPRDGRRSTSSPTSTSPARLQERSRTTNADVDPVAWSQTARRPSRCTRSSILDTAPSPGTTYSHPREQRRRVRRQLRARQLPRRDGRDVRAASRPRATAGLTQRRASSTSSRAPGSTTTTSTPASTTRASRRWVDRGDRSAPAVRCTPTIIVNGTPCGRADAASSPRFVNAELAKLARDAESSQPQRAQRGGRLRSGRPVRADRRRESSRQVPAGGRAAAAARHSVMPRPSAT